MAFEPVNELEKLLVAAATEASARPAFLRAILERDLFIITEGSKPEQETHTIAEAGTSIQIRFLEIEGKPHAPIFTSVERISAVVKEEVGYMGMNGRAALTMLRGTDLVLNPGSDYGKLFTPAEVESILDGSIFQPSTRDVGGKQILLAQPKEYPRHITDALAKFFETRREIKSAYLAHAMIAEMDQSPHTLIGVDVEGNWRAIVAQAGAVVESVARPGEIIDFLELPANSNEGVAGYMRGQTKPFYVRKKR